MTEYIERESILNAIRKTSNLYVDQQGLYLSCELIAAMPAADVQSAKRGHWYDAGAEYIKEIGQFKIHAFCSECHRLNYYMSDYSQNMETEFCQHCGADMRDATKG